MFTLRRNEIVPRERERRRGKGERQRETRLSALGALEEDVRNMVELRDRIP